MLTFDHRGHLTPYSHIQTSIEEFRSTFVDGIASVTRSDNFEKYIRYSDDLKNLLGTKSLKQWLNGSFVTRKTNPKDIDLVTFIDHKTIVRLGDQLDRFKADGGWNYYEVDAYVLDVHPKNSDSYKFTYSDRGDIFNKGFLEINY
jgi:hypothetical protein